MDEKTNINKKKQAVLDREARLKANMKANMKRRKAQAKARKTPIKNE